MKRRNQESGFAMLLVFLLSACIAITLYVEIPRVAFEAERQRELLLVDRGNQFKRAIQVFYSDKVNNPTHRYPATIEELESFNNHRYLRHKYVDPMTGKDEWRLVHINGGILTDSVTTQKTGTQAAGASGSTASSYLSQTTMLDTGDANGATGGVNRAMNRRQSEGGGAPGDPNNPALPPGLPGSPIPGASGLPPGVPVPGGPGAIPNMPNQAGIPPIPGVPGQLPTGVDPATGQPTAQQGTPPGFPPTGAPGFGPGGGANGQNGQQSPANMINGLLTTPRPGGMPSNMPGSTIGGGIAGVASKYEADGIMVINQRTKINEWEYIFDLNKYHAPPNPVAGTPGNQQQQNGPGGNNPMNGPGLGTGGNTQTGTGTGTGGTVIK